MGHVALRPLAYQQNISQYYSGAARLRGTRFMVHRPDRRRHPPSARKCATLSLTFNPPSLVPLLHAPRALSAPNPLDTHSASRTLFTLPPSLSLLNRRMRPCSLLRPYAVALMLHP